VGARGAWLGQVGPARRDGWPRAAEGGSPSSGKSLDRRRSRRPTRGAAAPTRASWRAARAFVMGDAAVGRGHGDVRPARSRVVGIDSFCTLERTRGARSHPPGAIYDQRCREAVRPRRGQRGRSGRCQQSSTPPSRRLSVSPAANGEVLVENHCRGDSLHPVTFRERITLAPAAFTTIWFMNPPRRNILGASPTTLSMKT
jgi:hypothetical protein